MPNQPKTTKPNKPPERFHSEPIIATLATHSEEERRTLRAQFDAGELHHLEFNALVYRLGPNRNHMRIYDADFPAFVASFVNAPFLRNHDEYRIESRDGTILASWADGNDLKQTIKLTTQRGILSYLEGQIDRFSVGWHYSDVKCSICNNTYWSLDCTHNRGRQYVVNGLVKTCELFFIQPVGKETSAVNVPAIEGTQIILAQLE